MTNDIFQLRPNFHGIGIDLNALWKRIRRQPPTRFEKVAGRFVELFEQHGVAVTQIPRLLPAVSLAQLASPASLLQALTSEAMDAACALFGVRREWLEGADDRIYEHRYCYKAPQNFFAELRSLQKGNVIASLRAFTTEMNLDYRNPRSQQRLELVMVEAACWLGDEQIMRYRPFSDGWDWAYDESRLQLKALVSAQSHPVPMFKVTLKEMECLYSGEILPGKLFRSALISNPSLEDYCMSAKQNRNARETEELDTVKVYQTAFDPVDRAQ